ncbi:ATP-binding cassette domain-containing protein [Amycolatopsis jiangsuensis]|uniref:ABC-2 type transport system ATP-binding protein n=1 Tax=Amycolatopsis jiangsuensis TaxID=1181879 RepID=A0A840IYD7_9PSEU|nr:ATP-binding cassette domain-containing protein [Amycolatopsis jiangsuensis]MBB4685884.1 ABC-2 type transport system ATP-binding protein [Amycolatopsis jiangsuensis]
MITFRGLTKRYGDKTVVDGLTSVVAPGLVTGFLGPNGAGKSTTMRMTVALDHPDSGDVLIQGKPYRQLRYPLREVGALLEAKAVHPGRSAGKHLLAMARGSGIPPRRVEEVLATVGLSDVAGKRTGTFSLGMSQRLGIAGALLGDPAVLMFDEPVNGLDPDGVRWVRQLMRLLAGEGRTVLVSSHLMSEMQLTADHLVVIGKGRLLADAPMDEFIAGNSRSCVSVRVPVPAELAALTERLRALGVPVRRGEDDEVLAEGVAVDKVGDLAHELGVRLHGLGARTASLEQAYLELTASSVEYGVRA